MRGGAQVAVAVVAGLLTTVGGFALDPWGSDGADGSDALGPGVVTVEVGIEHSRFTLPDDLRVVEGTLVRFVVSNGDPIGHEMVVGGQDVHRHHTTGTEPLHPPVPGEVTVGGGETGTTVYRFDDPGPVTYACHLPRHLEYGMVGQLEVVPAPG